MLEGKNIDNTHPAELKRLENQEIENSIKSNKKKIEFSIVSIFFFLFVSGTIIINPEIISPYFAIATGFISLIFVGATFVFREHLKTDRIAQKMLHLFYEHNNL